MRKLLAVLAAASAAAAAAAAHVAADVLDVRHNFPLALLLSTLAGASTGLGGLLAVAHRDLTPYHLGVYQAAAAGFMLSVSLVDLLPTALADLAPPYVALCALLGAAVFQLLKAWIPEPDGSVLAKAHDPTATTAFRSGLLTAAGLALHNFPEGVAVCVASLRGARFGLPLALAIGLHNVPEGVAVALPLYYATKSRAYAVRVAFLSGMAEPAGVVFVLAAIHVWGAITHEAIAASTAAVAGVMIVLSLAELLPHAARNADVPDAALATGAGLVTMTLLLRVTEMLSSGV